MKQLAPMLRLREIKRRATEAILPRADRVPEAYHATVCSFPMSYSVGRTILDFCREHRLAPGDTKILIVGAAGGRDYHWMVGNEYQVDVLDLGDHPWGQTRYRGDACDGRTWLQIDERYDLVIMCDVLEHLPEDFAALRHARSVLKAEGYLFLSVPYGHDLEPTHVRAYSYVTLKRLLDQAGFAPVWERRRPGALEVLPAVTIANYALSVVMPTAELGARLLHALLRMEFAINERTRTAFSWFGRSPDKGITLAARPVAGQHADYVEMNKNGFIPGAARGDSPATKRVERN